MRCLADGDHVTGGSIRLAAHGEHMRRAEVDEHEIPRKKPNDNYYSRLWSPGAADTSGMTAGQQAYSPDWRGEWVQQWRDTKDRDLTSRIRSIVKELIEAASVVVGRFRETRTRELKDERTCGAGHGRRPGDRARGGATAVGSGSARDG